MLFHLFLRVKVFRWCVGVCFLVWYVCQLVEAWLEIDLRIEGFVRRYDNSKTLQINLIEAPHFQWFFFLKKKKKLSFWFCWVIEIIFLTNFGNCGKTQEVWNKVYLQFSCIQNLPLLLRKILGRRKKKIYVCLLSFFSTPFMGIVNEGKREGDWSRPWGIKIEVLCLALEPLYQLPLRW